ncbi:MAG: leucine-rich repeat domain-containing protein [Kiritimatiellae bacterium]|nr:leucine-rich repeat domain-containing protein [Kiritimatiellia bacterium]
MRRLLLLLALFALPASAAWTVTTDGAPSGCTHLISDGNWQIGVTQIADGNWRLGKSGSGQGPVLVAGSGDLDLRSLEADCGVRLVSSSNGCLEKNTAITSAVFPDSFETMLGNTFKNVTTLTNVMFGSGMKTIGPECFRACTGLKTVNFPAGLEIIGDYVFNGCSSLELADFTFPVSVTTMGNHAFTGCTKITGTLTFPGLTTVSGNYQFEDCKGMTGFSAPSLCTIAEGMFNRCTALASASFSPDLASIGANAFNNGGALTTFYPTTMPKLASFGNYGLRGHKKLVADFDFSLASFTTLGYQALVDGEKIGTVKLPETLTTLGGGCLAYNSKGRVVWFYGAPPTTVDGDALNFKARGYLVAARKHAAEWKADSRVAALADADKALSDFPGLSSVKAAKGLQGTKPIGKWSTQTGNYWHWVVEELPPETLVLIK